MATNTKVKICGLSCMNDVAAATAAGASYVGFVFFEKSPRNVSINVARDLAVEVPFGVAKVALTVNADDATLDAINAAVPIDMWQLHGSETSERVTEVKRRFGLPVMKAVGIADAADLDQLDAFEAVADQILIDAKPPKNAVLPGGNGIAFDWRLIANRQWTRPWMLAGGLTPENVSEAVALTGTRQVDVSSGVEGAPGVKDEKLIAAFVLAAQT
ncbi:phosphoribosylanthranilate isomerase [Cochlodiniinecator piscidefendens]|uniref:phosphoribosylanthranilate isomerase n=1 Tax=Cochlodiniinecator piscidefendens TaxID=2715756 RepID=UPI0014098BAA|nr:phosphoribosylanthranilate isomerase [Cochlodiniinecator piscidefendens]